MTYRGGERVKGTHKEVTASRSLATAETVATLGLGLKGQREKVVLMEPNEYRSL